MIKVATEYHHASSDLDIKPTLKCRGTCKKVYWSTDVEMPPFGVQLHCEKCGGVLSSAQEGRDYQVLEFKPGIKLWAGSSIGINHSSQLLDEFIPLAKQYCWR